MLTVSIGDITLKNVFDSDKRILSGVKSDEKRRIRKNAGFGKGIL